VSSTGEPDSYALQLLVKRSENDGRSVRHFVCCECQGLVEALEGGDYLHTCEGGHNAGESAQAAGTLQQR
jgi:hypothetical protein